MRVHLRKSGIISTWKAYQIKGNIEAAHPEIFLMQNEISWNIPHAWMRWNSPAVIQVNARSPAPQWAPQLLTKMKEPPLSLAP